ADPRRPQNKHPTRVGGGGLGKRARLQAAGPEAVRGRSGDVGAGDQQAGDVGADDLTAGGGTGRTHGGAQRRDAETAGTQEIGAETAGTFGEAVEICGGAGEAQHAEGASSQSSGTGTGSGDRSSTNSCRTGTRGGGSSSSEPSRTGPGTGAGSGGSPSTSPSRTGTECEGGSAWDRTRNRIGVWRRFTNKPLWNRTGNRIGGPLPLGLNGVVDPRIRKIIPPRFEPVLKPEGYFQPSPCSGYLYAVSAAYRNTQCFCSAFYTSDTVACMMGSPAKPDCHRILKMRSIKYSKLLKIEFMEAEELYQRRVLTITGICVALLVVGIVCVVAYCKTKKQRKQMQSHLHQNQNQCVEQPNRMLANGPNHPGPGPEEIPMVD
ncbi:hypothetical protein ILYODFUR_016976, partial [Ilyodon furcidens]